MHLVWYMLSVLFARHMCMLSAGSSISLDGTKMYWGPDSTSVAWVPMHLVSHLYVYQEPCNQQRTTLVLTAACSS